MTNLTFTHFPAAKVYDGGVAGELIVVGDRYISPHVIATLASGYARSPISPKPSENFILAQLRPLERWRYVAKHNHGEFIIWFLALLGGAYMLISGAVHLGLSIFPSARAQNVIEAIGGSSRDPFDWYVGILMGICLLCSLGIIMWARNESKISFGKETTRTITGFVAGFLSCGKPH